MEREKGSKAIVRSEPRILLGQPHLPFSIPRYDRLLRALRHRFSRASRDPATLSRFDYSAKDKVIICRPDKW